MGYQESLIPITCLAEAQGIKDAIETHQRAHGGSLFYYCAVRHRLTDELFACVGGDRYPYQSMEGTGALHMGYLENHLGWDAESGDYPKVFEDLDPLLVLQDVPLHLAETFRARKNMIDHLRSIDDELKRREDEGESKVYRRFPPTYTGELEEGDVLAACYSDLAPSPLGYLLAISDGDRLLGLKFDKTELYVFDKLLCPEKNAGGWYPDGEATPFPQVRDWLDAYFLGDQPDPFALPIDPYGTPAKREILAAIMRIPYGETATYAEVARDASEARGKKVSAAVVRTVAEHNPLPIIIPSHRVVSAAGECPAGPGTMADTAWLLAHEGVDLERIKLPSDLEIPEYFCFDLYRPGRHEVSRVLTLAKSLVHYDDKVEDALVLPG